MQKSFLLSHEIQSLPLKKKITLFVFVHQDFIIEYKVNVTKHRSPETGLTVKVASRMGGCRPPHPTMNHFPGTTPFNFLRNQDNRFLFFLQFSGTFFLAPGSLCLPGKPICPQGHSQSLPCSLHFSRLSANICICYRSSAEGVWEKEPQPWVELCPI